MQTVNEVIAQSLTQSAMLLNRYTADLTPQVIEQYCTAQPLTLGQ